MNALRDRDPLTMRYARTLREASRDPYDYFYCAHRAKPCRPLPYLCLAIVALVLMRFA